MMQITSYVSSIWVNLDNCKKCTGAFGRGVGYSTRILADHPGVCPQELVIKNDNWSKLVRHTSFFFSFLTQMKRHLSLQREKYNQHWTTKAGGKRKRNETHFYTLAYTSLAMVQSYVNTEGHYSSHDDMLWTTSFSSNWC
jgi:hypothetical protein